VGPVRAPDKAVRSGFHERSSDRFESPTPLVTTSVHWVLYAIPPADTGAAEAAAPPGAKQGTNGFGLRGYLPPCPFVGLDPHKYVFELFASRKPVAPAARFRVGTDALVTPTG
jgi:phosphatidylethanolamine-binding protein (PEBP) family uncharacterized protein